MKCYIILFILYTFNLYGQITPTSELGKKLEGKLNFHDVKNTVLSYYKDELKKLSSKDSVQRKTIMRQLKMWNREFWINEYYTDKDDHIKTRSLVDMNAINERKKSERPTANRAQLEGWVSNGPISTNFSLITGEGVGRIDRIAFHPTNGNIIFAGSSQGGLFKTVDGGANWFPISAFVASLGISGIAINPTNPNVIYILTGDGNKSNNGGCFSGGACFNYISTSGGVYKTIDGGETWFRLPVFNNHIDSFPYFGRNIIIHPTNPSILYAATSKGLYKTTNGGNTWQLKTDTINIWDVVFKPGNPDSVYCVGNNFFMKINSAGAFKNVYIAGLDQANRVAIAVTSANPNKIALLAGNSVENTCVGVFVSNNGGISFDKHYDSSNGNDNLFHNYIDGNVYLKQQDYNCTIAISPTDENKIIVGGLCIWSSNDNGYNWTQETAYWPYSDILHEYIHPDQHHLIFHSNGKLYVGNDAGVYVSEDDGESWDFIETGLSITQFYHFEWENDEGDPWGGAQDEGIMQRLNYFEFTVYSGGDGYDVMTDHPWRASDGESNDVYYTKNESIGTDGASSISISGNTDFFGNLAMKPDEEDYIYVGYQHSTYYSVNQGLLWIPFADSIPGNWAICSGRNHPFRLYTAGNNKKFGGERLFRSDSRFENSIPITGNLFSMGYTNSIKISDIEVDANNDDIVYISLGSDVIAKKVFVSQNAGITWENISYNLPNVPVFCIKKDDNGGLYAGTSIGVYYKQANNDYWEPYYNELPAVPVTQIEIEGNFVHASTFGRGIWTTKKFDTCYSDLNLIGNTVGKKYFEASDIITSSQKILNSPGTSIIYSAGSKIVLTEGMKVKKGAKFHGVNQPCGSKIDLKE